MKTCLLALLFIATAATSAFAETYRAPITSRPKTQRERPAPLTPRKVDGVIPRGIRGGNLLQMFNPKAPAKYGTSQEAICYDPNDPAKWKGIKFFVFQF